MSHHRHASFQLSLTRPSSLPRAGDQVLAADCQRLGAAGGFLGLNGCGGRKRPVEPGFAVRPPPRLDLGWRWVPEWSLAIPRTGQRRLSFNSRVRCRPKAARRLAPKLPHASGQRFRRSHLRSGRSWPPAPGQVQTVARGGFVASQQSSLEMKCVRSALPNRMRSNALAFLPATGLCVGSGRSRLRRAPSRSNENRHRRARLDSSISVPAQQRPCRTERGAAYAGAAPPVVVCVPG